MPGPKLLATATPLGRKLSRYTMATQFPGLPGYIPSDTARAHILELSGFGLPFRSIAAAIGAHEESIYELANGRRPLIYTRRAAALMKVTHTPTPQQRRVLTIGATRRLRGLQVLSWSLQALADRSSLKKATLANLLSHAWTTTTYEVWAEVDRLYDELSGTPGPSPMVQRRALAKGWFSPLDWDWEDLDIDDPRVTPDRLPPDKRPTLQQKSAKRAAEVQRLTAAGLSAAQIADRMHLSVRQVVRLRKSTLPNTLAGDLDGTGVYIPAC